MSDNQISVKNLFEGLQATDNATLESKIQAKLAYCFKHIHESCATCPNAMFELQAANESLAFVCSSSRAKLFESMATDATSLARTYQFFELIANTLVYLATNLIDNLDFEASKPMLRELFVVYTTSSLSERQIYTLIYIFDTLNHFLPVDYDLRVFLNEKTRLGALLSFLDNKRFVSKMRAFEEEALSIVLFDLNWTSKAADAFKQNWLELNSTEKLLEFMRSNWTMIESADHILMPIYMIIANTASDKDIESLPEVNTILDKMVNCVRVCVHVDNEETIRFQHSDDDDDGGYKQDIEVKGVLLNNSLFSILGLLQSLFKLAVNDKIKWSLYGKPTLSDSLKTLTSSPEVASFSDVERQCAMQLLVQLSFDERVRSALKLDEQLVSNVNALLRAANTSPPTIKYKRLVRTCEQFKWLLGESKPNEQKTKQEETSTQRQHIMISYNTASRDMCLSIKSELEHTGLGVWIDVNEIHGSSLDSMAQAVENAQCVLMCVTEKYRQSNNCQAEA